MSNSLGRLFTVTSFGESHGRLVGVIIDGCPAGLAITEADIQKQLDKRKPGGSPASTTRKEEDKVDILCGIRDGHTTGAPIGLAVWNKDVDSSEYEKNRFVLRPGQADYTSYIKYGGFGDFRGGGRFSGRITASYVMAGAIALKLLNLIGTEVMAHTVEIGGIAARTMGLDEIKKNASHNPLRCADAEAARKMATAIKEAGRQGDSLGGIIEGIALGLPAGLGEPASDTLDAGLAKALFSIPAVKGVEFGTGFQAARKRGSQNNDPFAIENGKVVTTSNNAGGVLGGISNGMPLVVRVAIKPTPSISVSQPTVNIREMKNTRLELKGRHDVCIVPRAVAVVEAMMALTLCDFALIAGLIPRVIK
jgi:chorismate synthase